MIKRMGASVRRDVGGDLGGELGNAAGAILELETLTRVEAPGMLRGGRCVLHARTASGNIRANAWQD